MASSALTGRLRLAAGRHGRVQRRQPETRRDTTGPETRGEAGETQQGPETRGEVEEKGRLAGYAG